MNLTAALAIGLVLGLRHAFDADHLVAVTSMLSNGGRVRSALGVGLWWGMGHAVTLVGIGALVLATGWSFPASWQNGIEVVVGVTIVALGMVVLRNHYRTPVHWHEHTHADAAHAHFHHHDHGNHGKHGGEAPGAAAHAHEHRGPGPARALVVGAIHGIAGSGPLVILLALTLPTLALRYAALAASAFGTLVGMSLVTAGLALPFVYSRSLDVAWYARLQIGAGVAGVVYGVGFAFHALGVL
jgi:ABC-type nickel/cobalt efflux system permease component RcnA